MIALPPGLRWPLVAILALLLVPGISAAAEFGSDDDDSAEGDDDDSAVDDDDTSDDDDATDDDDDDATDDDDGTDDDDATDDDDDIALAGGEPGCDPSCEGAAIRYGGALAAPLLLGTGVCRRRRSWP